MKVYYKSKTGTLYQGHVLDVLRTLPNNSVDTIITSPPYWSLRDYGEETSVIWDGDKDCKHEWGNNITTKIRGSFENANVGSNKMECQPKELKQGQFCLLCGAWYGQLGLEPTLELYHKHLLQITNELKRILKPTGTMFWNHGNSYYSGGGKAIEQSYKRQKAIDSEAYPDYSPSALNRKDLGKCLTYQNYRLVLKMIDNQGWGTRNDLIWKKTNPMPGSQKDRFTNVYEPIFIFFKTNKPQYYYNTKTMKMVDKKPKELKEGIDWDWKEVPDFTKEKEMEGKGGKTQRNVSPSESGGHYDYGGLNSPFSITKGKVDKLPKKMRKVSYWKSLNYFFDLDAVRVPHKESSKQRYKYPLEGSYTPGEVYPNEKRKKPQNFNPDIGSRGKNPGDILEVSTQPFPESHFAKFPDLLIEPLIKVGVPKKVCKKCGKARVRISKKEIEETRPNKSSKYKNGEYSQYDYHKTRPIIKNIQTIGWTKCDCREGYEGGVVLDPFMGSGTVAKVAEKYNRKWIGIEISPKYCDMIVKMVKNTQRTLFDE